ncbi:hypothetical protein J7431_16335 [Xanthomonas phaseoli pv. dieffenbachiae]|uniref:hypothetical protein n=1 Tax=Xanthomonas TaxID=338 RepID=UPI000B17CE9E|nr:MULTISPECIES: hypothetical protein [Xanthomonas]MBO9748769.1 hypothetical protein [Xanthomonas phaseoli pv. dieffenbachiae]MBO9751541.1 hypothetical protein [Xanthomonas phaseoli pv. dieffenbachiae]MBO9891166.1 hypothetical protein [Xanthomonas sp. D-36-1]
MPLLRGLNKIINRWLGSFHQAAQIESLESELALIRNKLHEIERLTKDHAEEIKKISPIEDYLVKLSSPAIRFDLNIFSTIIYFTAVICIIGGCLTLKKPDAKEINDYLAYVCPIIAGLLAGLGLYVQKPRFGEGNKRRILTESLFYKASVLFLFLGLTSYFAVKGIDYAVIPHIFGFAGTLIAIYSVIKNNKNLDEAPSVVDKAFKPIIRAILALNIVASLTWAAMIIGNII